ncbi:MAG: stage V sporulation protein AA [Lachnospiraceae bacterium]|nr:stage V sporulation protein AA [Lachnospiraceae bacterium]
MSETIYLNVQQSSAIQRPVVRIGDVAEVFCENKTVKKQVGKIIITEFESTKAFKKVFSTCYLIQLITDLVPNCQVESIGETDFIVYYKPVGKQGVWKDRIKCMIVSLIAFFGAAFSIMTFNTDVTTPNLFAQLTELFTGQPEQGPGILQLTYSIGLFLGIILFFNHGGKYKLTNDPSPLQVQMRQYEQGVNQAFIIDAERNQENKDVDS